MLPPFCGWSVCAVVAETFRCNVRVLKVPAARVFFGPWGFCPKVYWWIPVGQTNGTIGLFETNHQTISFSDAETFSTKNLEAIRRLMLGPSERRKSLGHQYLGHPGITMDLGVRYPRSSFLAKSWTLFIERFVLGWSNWLSAFSSPRPQWFSLPDVASSTSSTLAQWRRIWHTCGFVDVGGLGNYMHFSGNKIRNRRVLFGLIYLA